jgi:hypothetical protein
MPPRSRRGRAAPSRPALVRAPHRPRSPTSFAADPDRAAPLGVISPPERTMESTVVAGTGSGLPISRPRERLLRFAFAANIVGAGVPGLAIILAPVWTANEMFAAPQDPVILGILGAIWLAIGMLSALALRNPLPFVGLLALQVVYKAVWLVAVALPLLLRGERLEDAGPLALLFALVVVCYAAAIPFAVLIARGSASRPVSTASSGRP